MQSQNRLFDDLVKVMNGAAGTLAGMTREAQSAMQDRARDWVGGLDLVSREEFEAVKAMATTAREENEALSPHRGSRGQARQAPRGKGGRRRRRLNIHSLFCRNPSSLALYGQREQIARTEGTGTAS